VLANVLRISDLARAYELTGGFSFRGFIEELNAQAEKTESPEAPVLEEASDGVRIMTVHAAKGLEFPVVVLADMTANLAAREADRYVDAERDLCATRLLRHCSPRELCDHAAREIERERAEGVRVCYVAATRARDLLVVPAVGDAPFEGWLAPLNKALYTVRNAQSVVRWHSSRLRLNVNQDHGLRDVDVLKAGGKGEESLAAYRDWRDHRARTIDGSARPEFDIAQVTGILNEPPEHSVSFASVSAVEPRPTGRRFGTLVHAVLRDVPPAATKEEIEALTAMHARIVSADAGETSAASLAVAAVLDHEIWRAASTSSNMHRELPVTLNLGEGRLLEGVLDLAYRDTNGWVVVDYKTDDSNQEIYIRQLRWYLHALSLAKGAPARGILLQV
jgi:ATP-dependent exoDNAse (exonuclease V) beta subunit